MLRLRIATQGVAKRWLEEQRPDVAIVVYNDHGADLFIDKMPTFAVGVADV